jgi:hypothetical protein
VLFALREGPDDCEQGFPAETGNASAQPRSCRDYFGVSFNSLLVGGVSVITPAPLSVNT